MKKQINTMKPKSTAKVVPAEKAKCESLAIGIDLGTTYSCVGVWKNGRVKIIANEHGNRTTPSCVAFTEFKRFVGEAARSQVALNPANIIYDTKRLMGKKFSDETVQEDIKLWPFNVVAGCGTVSNEKPMIVVSHKGEEKQFAAEEISSMVLLKLKESAEASLGSTVNNAVITVPAHFNDSQRQATKDAGVIAGLDFVHLVDEPVAAAVACAFDKNLNSVSLGKNVLIFDLGGGTFDVTLLSKEQNLYQVRAVDGDAHLGGRDFDNKLVSHILKEFKKKHGKDISGSLKSLERLRTSCERAKRILSSATEATIELDCLFEGIDFNITISRALFNVLNVGLFKRCMSCLEKCLEDGKVSKSNIDTIVLVGGSTRIPMVQQMLKLHFRGKKLYKDINPDEAVANGAVILSALLNGNHNSLNSLIVGGVTSSSLGLRVYSGDMSVVIPQNTAIPSTIWKKGGYTTSFDNHTDVSFPVYAGENLIAVDNQFLDKIVLRGIPPAPQGVPKFDVCFDINADGILTVTAELQGSKKSETLVLKKPIGRLEQTVDIEKIVEAVKHKKPKVRGVLANLPKGFGVFSSRYFGGCFGF